MGKFFNKLRQVFNIFLIMLLIGLAAAVFVYFLTTPEQRNVSFWISVGFLIFALILETLMFSGIAMRSNSGRNIPMSFTQAILGGVYFLFVIVVSVGNALANFSVVKYMLIHIGGLVIFLIPMMLVNMAALKLTSSESKQQDKGRFTLSSLSNIVSNIADDLKNSGIAQADMTRLMNFSDALKYSDPSPASGRLERALEGAVHDLEEAASGKDLNAVMKACTLAERALKERNEEVLNSK